MEAKSKGLKLKEWEKENPRPKHWDYIESGHQKPQLWKVNTIADIEEEEEDEEAWEDESNDEVSAEEDEDQHLLIQHDRF